MPTDLCRWCGTAYEIVHGHQCMPTVATTRINSAHAQMTEGGEDDVNRDGTLAGAEVEAHAGPAGPPIAKFEGGDAIEPLDQDQIDQGGTGHVTGLATTPTVAGPTLQQAIEAGAFALSRRPDHDEMWDWQDVAEIVVEAAAPILTRAAHQRVEELTDLLEQASEYVLRVPAENAIALYDQIEHALDQTREQADG